LQSNWATEISQRYRDTNWREAILLAAGYLAINGESRANTFVRLLAELGVTPDEKADALTLAGQAWGDLPVEANTPLDPQRLETRELLAPKLEDWLHANPPRVPAPLRRPLGLALAALGDPRLPSPSGRGRRFAYGGEGDLPAFTLANFIPIPAGPFRMGTNDEDERALKQFEIEPWKDEKPAHTVEVSDFKIARWPVTNAEFESFMNDDGYNPEKPWWQGDGQRWRTGAYEPDLSIYDKDTRETVANWLKDRPVGKRNQPFFWDDPQWNAANLPVVGVTWFEAMAYCQWLNDKLKGQLPAGWRVRLPTEAEWEKAARRSPLPAGEGGDAALLSQRPHRGVRASLWPWGNHWDAERCNSEESKFNATTPVGMYPHGATADGVEDLIGNVWEWCLDAWDEKAYEKHAARDPFITTGLARVLRGGSFFNFRGDCRSAFRLGVIPVYFNQYNGFRVCVSPIPHSEL
jgi:formylglycine-generating enzyme required for sulfatase activity